ncbi:PAS domain-containing sensor histidine kinase [Mucilaginibacter ginkgonis]|uniref:histidine kinase n=1 Tax=Mucilaginibacter ginkgonis TaxID=2682091 RepID=A0A6I4IMW4_9SPHI|nr:PAS domain-containing sensor histidine kinase [Mucilaginibacter ginkgonis]QQL49989.1 PAS domain-containing sensor histidine kinase [Mucilaginibacter ginkgonis]
MAPSNILNGLAKQASLFFFSYSITNTRFEYLNPAFTEFFGVALKSATLRKILSLIYDEDRRYIINKIKDCINGDDVINIECRIVRGSVKWVSVSFYLVKQGKNLSVTGYAENINAVKNYSVLMNDHNTKKNSILNILAHELAGPISTIENLTSLMKQEVDELDNSNLNEYIRMIRKISSSSTRLIRTFINEEFLESAGIELKKTRVDLVEKINTGTKEYFVTQHDTSINLKVNASKKIIYVEIDEDKFMQVMHNLISNSLKFTPDGGEISIFIDEDEDAVRLSVADNGVGIPERFHQNLFNKFSGAGRSGLRGEKSTGLGMYLIKTIVDWHQGSITFNSAENAGTTFIITLPK